MEDWQRQIILNNHAELIQLVQCDPIFTSILRTNNSLSDYNVEELDNYEKQHIRQAKQLLKILITKVNGYNGLKIALEKTEQTGALDCLNKAEIKNKPDTSVSVDPKSQPSPPNLSNSYQNRDIGLVDDDVPSIARESPIEATNTNFRQYNRIPSSPHQKIQTHYRKFHLIFSTPDKTTTIQRIKEEHGANNSPLIINETAFPDGFSLQTSAFKAGVNIISHERHPLATLLRKVEDNESTFQAVIVTSENTWDIEIALDKISNPEKFEVLKEDLTWTFITTEYQEILLGRIVRFQGNRLCLREIACDPSSLNTMSLSLLVSLINDEEPVVCGKTCVKEPSKFYIQRALVSRRSVSTKIMEQSSELSPIAVEGVTDDEMKAICRGSFHGSDTQVNKDIPCKNIILKNASDFKKLAKKGRDIYWLRKDRNDNVKQSLTFIQASDNANLSFIQNYIKPDFTNGIIESELVDSEHQEPICIGDMPGMGKTELLRSIAYRLMSQESTRRRFVFFSNMTELLKDIPDKEMATVNNVLEAIISKADTGGKSKVLIHSLVTKYIENVYNIREIKVEILIDGFDDVLQERQAEVSLKILGIIRSFKNTRLWVALRSHMLNQVEDTLKVIGYNMKPLLTQDQIQFLVNYWQSSKDKVITDGNSPRTLNEKRLRVFATNSLTIIRKNLHEEKVDTKSGAAGLMYWEMTGNPLQCYLIAEAYIEDAISFAQKNSHHTLANIVSKINSSSINDLFQRIFEKKHDIYLEERAKISFDENSTFIRKDSKDAMMKEHIKYAIKSLFPDSITDFDVLFETNNPKSQEHVTKYGLITFDPVTGEPEFVHKTYAEFFIAQMVVELGSSVSYNSELITKLAKFFVHKVLSVGYPEMDPNTHIFTHPSEFLFSIWNGRKPKSPYFTNPVIPYFINSFLDESKGKKILKAKFRCAIATTWMKETGLLVSERCPKFVAAILSNYFKIVEVLIKSLEDKNLKHVFIRNTHTFHKNMVHFAAEHCSKECVELICDLLYPNGKIYKQFLSPSKISYMSRLQMPINVLKVEEPANIATYNPLHAALERGEYDIYKLFVATQGFDVKRWQNIRDLTPNRAGLLHYVIKDSWHDTESVINGKIQIIESILQADSKTVLETDDDGRTPLLVPDASVDLLKVLVRNKANIHAEDKIEKKTILHMICAMQNVQIYTECLALLGIDKMESLSPVERAEKFTKIYTDILIKEREGELKYTLVNEVDTNNNVLHLPSTFSRQTSSSSQSLYQTPRSSTLSEYSNNTSQSFYSQSSSSSSDTTAQTYDSKKSIDITITQELMSSLLEANKFAKSIAFLDYLITEVKSKKNTFCPKSSKGVTPLHYAAAAGNLEVIKLFIDEHKADVNIEDAKERTMLYHVTRSKTNVQLKIVKYLVKRGAVDKNGKSLSWVLIKGSPEKEVVEYLDKKLRGRNRAIEPKHYVDMVHNVFCNPKIDVVVLKDIIEHFRKIARVNLLTKHEETGRTILHHAALNLKLDGLKFAMELVKKFRNDMTSTDEFVLTEDNYGNTLWHMVYLSYHGAPQSFEEKMEWLKNWKGKLPSRTGENQFKEMPSACKDKKSKTLEEEKRRMNIK